MVKGYKVSFWADENFPNFTEVIVIQLRINTKQLLIFTLQMSELFSV
jgi:hypothetical protein